MTQSVTGAQNRQHAHMGNIDLTLKTVALFVQKILTMLTLLVMLEDVRLALLLMIVVEHVSSQLFQTVVAHHTIYKDPIV